MEAGQKLEEQQNSENTNNFHKEPSTKTSEDEWKENFIRAARRFTIKEGTVDKTPKNTIY